MKKFTLLLSFVFTLIFSSAWAADCEVSTGADAVTKGMDASCTNLIIALDITLAEPIDITNANITIYGKTGSEKISGSLDSSPVISMSANGITVRNLKVENTSSAANSYGVLTAASTSGGSVYNVDFVDCSQECIHVAGTSSVDAYQNSFRGIAYDKTIFYENGTHTAPSFTTATLASDASNWSLNLTSLSAPAGKAEAYVKSGNDIVPAVTSRTDTTATTAGVIINFTYLPLNDFYAIFTPTSGSTSVFSSAYSIDWTVPTNFDWGAYSACRTSTWFTAATGGQWAGDYDSDGRTNTAEDVNSNCTKNDNETDPAVSDTANTVPTAAVLTYPADGATDVETSLTFKWTPSTDPESDAITYKIYYCDNIDFSGCDATTVAANDVLPKNNYAGGAIFMIGSLVAGTAFVGRRRVGLLIIALACFGASISSCGGDSAATTTADATYSVASALNGSTTYYWKVRATDAVGFYTDSSTSNFTTR